AEETYLSLERVREGVRILFAREGGIEIESHPELVQTFIAKGEKDIQSIANRTGIPPAFFASLYRTFEKDHFAFLEINPLVVQKDKAIPLDAAVLVDSTASFFLKSSW